MSPTRSWSHPLTSRTGFQAYEYHISPFTWADSVFGNTFYFSTGAHGLHVILGTTMLGAFPVHGVVYLVHMLIQPSAPRASPTTR
jgi:heme/copper-type cytochrome/quinol oxidase subunit 3